MGDTHPRASLDEIKNAYERLFRTTTGLAKIKDAALGGRLFSPAEDGHGVPGRSIAWKMFLARTEPLGKPAGPPSYLDALRASRREFAELMVEKMRAPDGTYEDGFVVPGTASSPAKNDKAASNLEKNNPLSLHDDNPWREWFAAIELRKTILQDVERTFPDIAYFRDPDVQSQLTNILYLYSVMHPDIGYRQGMHEILAPLYHAIDYDSLSDDSHISAGETELREFCSRLWASADAWELFCTVMRGISRWYEWREPSIKQPQVSPLASHVQLSVGRVDMAPYVAPIVETCQRLQSHYLKSVDPMLWKSMQAAGIEPQIYGIRWLRLLFTREFPLADAMIVWDGLFACDPSFDLTPWICVAMLIRIRNQLIPADYSGQLTFLLRYPSPPAPDPEDPPTSHHATFLLRQALTLQMSPTQSTGQSVILENRNLLNIPMEVPDPPPPPGKRRAVAAHGHGERGKSISASDSVSPTSPRFPGRGPATVGHRPQGSQQSLGLPETWTKGLLDRGESFGFARNNIMNAVSELRRNLPNFAESAAQLVRTPMSPSPTSQSTFPMAVERAVTVEERPPWEPRTRFEMEKDIVELKSVQQRVGKAVNWIVDALLQDDSESDDPVTVKSIKLRKREALESLAYVRDILNGSVTEIEDDRLISEEEVKHRKAKAEERRRSAEASVPPEISPPQPTAATLPAPSAESRPIAARARAPAPESFSPSTPRSPPKTGFLAHSSMNDLHRASALPSSPPVLTPSSSANSTVLAPWNYTPSRFSSGGTSDVPLSPPPSAALRPAHNGPLSPTFPNSSEQPPRRTVVHDPLGAIR